MTVLYNPHAPADAHLIAKYDGRAPRYTSYPTAVQFTADVDEATYRGWLAALPPGDPVSVYMHIPFCTRLCWYCGCNTRAVTRHEPIRDYVALLMTELSLLEQALPARMAVGDIHLGGGSPNMLSVEELDLIFAGLRSAFAVAPDAEIAAELDPAVLSGDWIAAAARNGLSRASLGVQNLAPEVQKAVNRQERFEEIADCVEALRAAGVASINLDLMYGLPHQTTRNTLTTLDAVLTLRPERLALFGYAHVPWMKAHQQLIDEAALPGPAERLEQSQAAAERLKAEGYVQIGLDHFALPDDALAKAATHGGLHRNFQGYTTDLAGTLLGLGASAIGTTPGGYVQNVTQELGWRHAVADGKLPIARGVVVNAEDRFRADIIERLMCDFAVDLVAACARHGRDLSELEDSISRLHDFLQDGLATWDGCRLTVTPRGRMLVRSICALFDAYLAPDAQRHAKAI
ncbi:oxygen-independent coproporphyrinogen III oxidase [Phenylobacterium sp.]|uniref:oxygen-independent coproporphyrinogen III oxidase n=1 Tax=Phenylobacterium sp. TaxID=1871053 RepID=UPI002731D97E|nr:oxygen-independent coproporphyrinogen III oxidase [Phenylobacterium sp.]MDP1618715.1 oxygen-independent coproporphyrinogen III oxidase [Phenylobacterium sp.]